MSSAVPADVLLDEPCLSIRWDRCTGASLRDSWLPLAVAAGINRLAVVVARHGLGKFATEAILGKFEKTAFQTHMFDSLPEALKWTSQALACIPPA